MDRTEKIANPTKFYRHPEEVKKDLSLSKRDRVKLLENWLDEIIKKQVAEDESMIASGKMSPDITPKIHQLLHSLQNYVKEY